MDTVVNWKGKVAFEASGASGAKVMMDGSPEIGGEDKGARPMELLLMGMGGCTGIDMVLILQKMRAEIEDFSINISSSRADEEPKVFTSINVHYILKGKGLKEKMVQRAIDLTAHKYCSASIMLGKTAKITHSFEIHDSAAL